MLLQTLVKYHIIHLLLYEIEGLSVDLHTEQQF